MNKVRVTQTEYQKLNPLLTDMKEINFASHRKTRKSLNQIVKQHLFISYIYLTIVKK